MNSLDSLLFESQPNDVMVSTGYPSVDSLLLGGIARGELMVVTGDVARGKTTLALNIAYNLVSRGHKVLLASNKASTGRAVKALQEMSDGKIRDFSSNVYFEDNDDLKSSVLSAYKQDVDTIIVDSLSHYAVTAAEIHNTVATLKDVAVKHNSVAILVCTTRGSFSQRNGYMPPQLLKVNNTVAEAADVILTVTRSEEHPDKLFLRVDKNRNRGIDHTISNVEILKFDGKKQTINEREVKS